MQIQINELEIEMIRDKTSFKVDSFSSEDSFVISESAAKEIKNEKID